jgi:hypothetical protein
MGRKLNAILRFSNFQDVALPEAAFAQKFSAKVYRLSYLQILFSASSWLCSNFKTPN